MFIASKGIELHENVIINNYRAISRSEQIVVENIKSSNGCISLAWEPGTGQEISILSRHPRLRGSMAAVLMISYKMEISLSWLQRNVEDTNFHLHPTK